MRCSCTACLLAAALALLRTGRTGMATLLIEQALAAEQGRAEQDRAERRKLPVRRGRKARS
jgi:hypothetical protein